MRYCRICGTSNDNLENICPRCKVSTQITKNCVPQHIQTNGYMTIEQLNRLTGRVPMNGDEPRSLKTENASPSISWFSVSMGMVKFMGVGVTCLTIIFFLIVMLKAFM